MKAIQEQPTHESESVAVLGWRCEQLLRSGFEVELAQHLAAQHDAPC